MVTMHRRDLLRALAASLVALPACRRARRMDGRTVITFWFAYGGKNREVLMDLLARFNASQSRVFVEATYQGDYFEALAKLRTALAAGHAPTFSHIVGEVIPYMERANVLEPLDDYEGARDLPLIHALSQGGAFRGGDEHPLVAIPFNRSTPIMYLNGEILERDLGGAIPQSWDELLDAAKKLTDERALRWGFEVPINWWFWVAMVGQAGGSIVADDGTPTLGGEAGEKALRFLQRLVHTERVMRAPPGRDYNAWQAANQNFLAGRAAITWTSTAYLRYLEETARFPVVAAPLPRDVKRSVPTGGTFFVVLRSAPVEEKRAAWEFLRWMCEPEQTIDWATRTGYMPVTRPAIARLNANGYYFAHPNDSVGIAQLRDAEPWPWSPTLFRIQRDVIDPTLETAVLENRDAHTIMEQARAEALER
jgi:sn-glycerol 3-phosphate transport system substrate-binding protein